MSWRKYNKLYCQSDKSCDVWYTKLFNTSRKKFRVRQWLKANRKRGKK